MMECGNDDSMENMKSDLLSEPSIDNVTTDIEEIRSKLLVLQGLLLRVHELTPREMASLPTFAPYIDASLLHLPQPTKKMSSTIKLTLPPEKSIDVEDSNDGNLETSTSLAASKSISPSKTMRATFGGYLRLRQQHKGWRMRTWYCVMNGTFFIWYPSKENANEGTQIQGEIQVTSVKEWDGKGVIHTYANSFLFESKQGLIFQCVAPSKSSQQEWIQRMQEAIDFHKDNIKLHRFANNSFDNSPVSSPTTPRSPINSSGSETLSIDRDSEYQKTKIVGYSTAYGALAGAATGAVVGSVIPVVGTVIGGAIGGAIANNTARAKRNKRVNAAIGRNITYEELRKSDTNCTTCNVEFTLVKKHHKYCQCCFFAFCRAHCSKRTFLPQSGITKNVIVCDGCFQRQEFINFIFVRSSEINCDLDETKNEFSGILHFRSSDAELNRIRQVSTSKRFTILSWITSLHSFRNDPLLFSISIFQGIRFVETTPHQLNFYWIQFVSLYLSLVKTLKRASGLSQIQMCFYLEFIAAVCRRSNFMALKTIWQLLAMYEDALEKKENIEAHYILLLMWIITQFGDVCESGMITDLWLKHAPAEQAEVIYSSVSDLFEKTAQRRSGWPAIFVCRWLNAMTPEEFSDAHSIVVKAIEDETIFDVLLPFAPADGESPATIACDNAPSMRRYLSVRSVQRERDLFDNEAVFIQNITNIAEHLRFIKPVEERSKHLPGLLDDLQKNLPKNVYIPITDSSGNLYDVVNVLINEGKVFSTRVRAPTLIVLEVVKSGFGVSHVMQNIPSPTTTAHSSSATSSPLSDQLLESYIKDINSSPMDKSISEEYAEALVFEKEKIVKDSPQELLVMEAQQQYEGRSIGCESASFFQETWDEKVARIRETSEFSHLPNWRVISIIAKSFDDMRQEVFALQLIHLFKRIFENKRLDFFLRSYRIICTGPNIGLIETLHDTCSLDGLKKKAGFTTLSEYFETVFGARGTSGFQEAQNCFIKSMAAYSLVCYFLQIKDRHNGNILLDNQGHIIHIDFGFLLGIAPGGSFSLEDAPFKLTNEMVDVMGGEDSAGYQKFVNMFVDGFLAAKERSSKILALVKLTMQDAPFPCFVQQAPGDRVLRHLRGRFVLEKSDAETCEYAKRLVYISKNHWGTRNYDRFQEYSNGIRP